MKHSSIQTRVTLFYSSLMIMLTLFLIGFLLSTADTQAETISHTTLEQAVKEASEDISYYDDRIEIDPDFDFYPHSVTLVLYGPLGTSLAGTPPTGFPAQTPLLSDEFQVVHTNQEEWTIYDLYIQHPDASALWIRGIYSMDGTTRMLQALHRIVILILPIFLILALIGGHAITRRAFLPVARIREAAEDISSGNDLSRRIPLHKPQDELYELTETLNGMIERLEETFEHERRFASDVSHELRTPVSVILSQCDYLLTTSRTEEELREGLISIERQTRRMSSLISQLLELSRSTGKATLLQKERVDLCILCEMLCEEMEEDASEKNIKILTDFPDSLEAEVDQTLFMRMLINLLSNGIRYGKDGGILKVELSQTSGTIRLKVFDDGIGIAEENIDKIFQRLYRVDTARTGSSSGSFGLGLSFVLWIAEAHGGSVNVESTLGAGSCFTVEIPG